MAAAAVKFGKELECSICLDQYVNPKLLSCMHTFCSNCISKLLQKGIYHKDQRQQHQHQFYKQHNQQMTVTCPECRAFTKVFFL